MHHPGQGVFRLLVRHEILHQHNTEGNSRQNWNHAMSMANTTIIPILGKIHTVPVRIGDHVVCTDFHVIDTHGDRNACIVLGRPFLATVGGVIDLPRKRVTQGETSRSSNSNLENPPPEYCTNEMRVADVNKFGDTEDPTLTQPELEQSGVSTTSDGRSVTTASRPNQS